MTMGCMRVTYFIMNLSENRSSMNKQEDKRVTEQCTTEFQGFFAEFYDMLHAGCGDQAIYPELLKPYGRRSARLRMRNRASGYSSCGGGL